MLKLAVVAKCPDCGCRVPDMVAMQLCLSTLARARLCQLL